MDPLRDLVDWIEIPSITGDEADYADALARRIESEGFAVERQAVDAQRFNLLARAGDDPEVVFCTHLDTVPPFFPSRVDADYIHGRGSCDAKGQAVAMLAAARQLLKEGETRIGFLFTVGEEIDSVGARRADALLADGHAPRFVIVGEPTDNTFVRAHKGIVKARLVAHGVAGHSSQEVGPSAVHELVQAASKLLDLEWGTHSILGAGTLNLGQIRGGVAPNVVAELASAEVLVRTVEPPDVVENRIRSCLGPHVDVQRTYECYGPVEFVVPEGEESKTVAFGTDAPHMPRWGRPLLYGCGSILDAHTDHEKLEKRSLERCIERHVKTVRDLLAQVDES